ncbi:nucleotidyltransferase substrate binding protein [Algoriphagus halophytocola]|uniref:Nucleotidyltransferase substrate binding protein n=1 Tax=Algoriphagus halophytocola TaxID=2991499 RepID=A0ABY6MMV4_9BACT|nr:nucleotidyltransferase substrate binding protein [Algoriphagus sp. TR-M5]UZD24493.1 nucleotidyltransferase substrate binding protein [Algoriphagus sp. TR-M5]
MKKPIKTCSQLLEDYSLALEDLTVYSQRSKNTKLSESQSRELISSFEKTHELALSIFTAFFKPYKKEPFSGSRDLTVEAFHADLIDDGQAWLEMIIDRIKYNPLYEIDTQEKFLENINKKYVRLLQRFEDTMAKKLDA